MLAVPLYTAPPDPSPTRAGVVAGLAAAVLTMRAGYTQARNH